MRWACSASRIVCPHNAHCPRLLTHLVKLVLHDLQVQLHHVVATQPLKVVWHRRHMQVHLQDR